MKTSINYFILFAIALGITITFTQCQKDSDVQGMNQHAYQQNPGNQGNAPGGIAVGAALDPAIICECLTTNFTSESLNAEEKEALLFMREEEKLARDVYVYLNEKWNLPIFANIARSEEQHMAAILCLINRYELGDPVGENTNGVFVNTELASLYQTLTTQGNNSIIEALKVGATIEDLDIADLVALTEGGKLDNADILAVFAELTKGSRNHLRAFTRNLSRYGEIYTPVYLSEIVYNEIIATPQERGGQLCAGLNECPNQKAVNQGNCPNGTNGTCDYDCTGQGPGNGAGKNYQKKGGPN